MSVRLSVVLCQAAGGSAACRDHEGDLVAQLIGAPGLDLSLVGPIEHLEPDGTDQLLLGGLLGDLAIVSWHSPAQALALCHSVGVRGFRARHSLDELGSATPPNEQSATSVQVSASSNEPALHSPAGAQATDARRLYLFDLSSHNSNTVVAGLQRLLQARRTQTVAISVAGKPFAVQPTATASVTALQKLTDANDNSGAGRAKTVDANLPGGATDVVPGQPNKPDQFAPIPAEDKGSSSEPLQFPQVRQPRKTSGTTEWDQLVEELNDLDI